MRNRHEIDEGKLKEALKRLPSLLFRYASLRAERREWIRDVILGSKIYYASASSFNDPLDCHIPPDFRGSQLKIREYWRRYVKRKFPQENVRNHKNLIAKMVSSSTIPQKRQPLIDAILEAMDKHGVVCFSTIPNETLMWAYYADGQRGICLGFSTTPEYLTGIPGMFFPIEVRYETDFPFVSYYDSDTFDFITTVFGVKDAAWAHEHEWRIISPSHVGYKRFPPAMLSQVILGSRISNDDETYIRQLITQSKRAIKLRKVRHMDRRFTLECVDIE